MNGPSHRVNARATQRTALALLAAVAVASTTVAVAQRAASSPRANIERGSDVTAMLDSCHRLPRKQELLCARKVLSDYIAELGPLIPRLEARIKERRQAIANQEAAEQRFQSELVHLDNALGSPQLSSSNRQSLSQRKIELQVYISATKWNIDGERTTINKMELMLSEARRSLAAARDALQQIQEELAPGSRPHELPSRR